MKTRGGTSDICPHFAQEKDRAEKSREQEQRGEGAVDGGGHIKVCRGQQKDQRSHGGDAEPRARRIGGAAPSGMMGHGGEKEK